MTMDVLREIVGWVVMIIGFGVWVVFLPQISLLYKVKEAKSISLLLIMGSFAMQAIILFHIAIQVEIDWNLAMVYITSLISLIILLGQIYYYRRFPGGRSWRFQESRRL